MKSKPKRNRPVLQTTVSNHTMTVLDRVAKEVALPNFGVAVDYIVNDWVGLKQTAVQTAAPVDPEVVPA